MPARRKVPKKRSSPSALQQRAGAFFGGLADDEHGRRLLTEQNHRIEFDLTDADPFRVHIKNGKIATARGSIEPPRYDVEDLIHFESSQKPPWRDFLKGKSGLRTPSFQFARMAAMPCSSKNVLCSNGVS